MKSYVVLLAFGLVAAAGAASAATVAAKSDSSCPITPKTAVECGIWALKCIGDALGGNACHGAVESKADPGLKESVQCAYDSVRNFLEGTPQPCPIGATGAAGPDVKETVDCTKKAVRDLLQGTPQPCPL